MKTTSNLTIEQITAWARAHGWFTGAVGQDWIELIHSSNRYGTLLPKNGYYPNLLNGLTALGLAHGMNAIDVSAAIVRWTVQQAANAPAPTEDAIIAAVEKERRQIIAQLRRWAGELQVPIAERTTSVQLAVMIALGMAADRVLEREYSSDADHTV